MRTRLYKFLFLLILSGAWSSLSFGQNIDFENGKSLGNLYIRMYGEVHYYQPIKTDQYASGKFDAKRIVALFGYQFDRNTQFVTEWELEHANEIFLEQAFIKHRVFGNSSIKAGMILIPMGIINEYHEPNNYFSVDRPYIDRNLVPTTWRDIGIGLTGLFPELDLKYQLYVVNGLIGFKDGQSMFNSSSNYRSGRQKGIKTILSGLPAVSGQLEYYGFTNGKIGLSFYSGESNSDAFEGNEREDELLKSIADSTTVNSTMLAMHTSFNLKKWTLKTQSTFALNGNINAYNSKAETDLRKHVFGNYIEVGHPISKNEKWLAFGRYGLMSSSSLEQNIQVNTAMTTHILTTGFNYFAAPGAVFKLETQWLKFENSSDLFINSGIGVWF